MLTMLFSAERAYGILSAEAGFMNSRQYSALNIIVQVFISQRNSSRSFKGNLAL